MEETLPLGRSIVCHLSKAEMTRQFLEDSIFTIEFHLEKARADHNQKTAEVYSDLLMKIRQMLGDLQSGPAAS